MFSYYQLVFLDFFFSDLNFLNCKVIASISKDDEPSSIQIDSAAKEVDSKNAKKATTLRIGAYKLAAYCKTFGDVTSKERGSSNEVAGSESAIQPMPYMQESLVDECIAIVNQFQWEDDCNHEEFIKDGDGFLDGDENALDNNDDEIIAAREKLEHYTKECREFQEELREMAMKRKHISKESIQGNGVKENDDGYDSEYRCADDEDSPYSYDETKTDDDTESIKKKKLRRQRGEVFDPNTKAEHVMFNIANEYRNVEEFRDALHNYIAIQGYDVRLVKSDQKRVTAKCFASNKCNWRIHTS
ncbi:hypothetical protein Cgig2_012563 [Carnegiea gigantea]|uniref:Transposase MuDR plant domain-containing protein n=1 Tax=Carnegiea gigantea TaxID=171969 RepID=A0A9Q1K2G8_9CARY|nr:hypothetical protein Cgig2_012563 [Carnegiea gigantea]